MTGMPAGPWLLVIGMHRSGTSAVTGALGAMGFNLVSADDRMDWPESNPEHWESISVTLHNEDLLDRLGGGWDAPPELPGGWEQNPGLLGGADPTALMATAYPEEGPSVWKDPRLCLLLPYWRDVLASPLATILVWRSPMAVARSLQQRDGMAISDGLALWERYNRSAIEGLDGTDTFVVDYQSVVDDPGTFARGVADWLRGLSQFASAAIAWDTEGAAASIAGELRHQPDRCPGEDEQSVSAEQRALAAHLSGLSGGHRPLRSELPVAESAWAGEVIRLRRELKVRTKEADAANEELAGIRVELQDANSRLKEMSDDLEVSNQKLANLHASTSWKITKPLRSVVSSVQNAGRPTPDA